MGGIILGLLAGITVIEETISFMLFIEKEAIDTTLMAVFQSLRANQRAEAMRLILELESVYLRMFYADLETVWGDAMGFNIGFTITPRSMDTILLKPGRTLYTMLYKAIRR